jgi:hypothetical protein
MANAPICKQCAMQRILKSAKKFFKVETSAENLVLPFSVEVSTLKNFPDSTAASIYSFKTFLGPYFRVDFKFCHKFLISYL